MTGIEVARFANENGATLFRLTKGATDYSYDAKLWGTGNKRGWIILDSFSASAIVQVYDALNETNKAKYATLSISKMAEVAFKLAAKRSA